MTSLTRQEMYYELKKFIRPFNNYTGLMATVTEPEYSQDHKYGYTTVKLIITNSENDRKIIHKLCCDDSGRFHQGSGEHLLICTFEELLFALFNNLFFSQD